jgi:pyridoxal phosphate phosphatase PHOSPHO2
MAGIMVVFDFDKTIIELDSDNWIIDELGFTDLFNRLLPTMPWNPMMDKIMNQMHAQGVTIEDVEEVLRRTPMHPRIVPVIKTLHASGCELRIVSDANMFFIETILDHLGIRNCFSEINSNPGYVDDEGRLRISPYVDFQSSPHGCSRCPPNMCKGMVIERIQASMSKEGKKRMIYLGDGIGDFCPSLKLKEGDIVMPRKNFPVWDLICKNRAILRAEIREWSDGEELEQLLPELVHETSIEGNNNSSNSSVKLLSVDCKLRTLPPMEALPKPLEVNQ